MVLRNVVVRASESCAVHVARRKSGVCPDASGLQRGEFCMLRLSVMALVVGSLASGPVFAEASSGQQQLGKKDPNEVVCERQEETGSRLGSTRVCKTRAQWAEDRRVTRQEIEQVQVQRGCKDTNSC